jgi:molybdate transport system regulatory protein
MFKITADMDIRKNGRIFLDMKRIRLLRRIHFTGSILAASKEMEISYQLAWAYIKAINEISPLPVVVRQRGGQNGGGAQVTEYGLQLVRMFLTAARKHEDFLLALESEVEICSF